MNKQKLWNIIYNKYGSLLLSRKQVASELGRSVATIDRWKKQGLYLEYKKLGKAKNAPVEYPIDTVVGYIINNNKKMYS